MERLARITASLTYDIHGLMPFLVENMTVLLEYFETASKKI